MDKLGIDNARAETAFAFESLLTFDIVHRAEQILNVANEVDYIAAECIKSAQIRTADDIGARLQALSRHLRAAGAGLTDEIAVNKAKHEQILEALAVSERQFRSLAENLPDNIARWDCLGNYIYVNPTHARTLARPASELVGTRIPEQHGQVIEAIAHAVTTGQALPFVRQELRDGNGDVQVHEVSMIPERNAQGQIVSVLGIGRDVTEQVRMQESLAASERQFRTLAANLPNYLARYTSDANTVYLNPRLETLLGYRIDQMIGSTPTQIFPDGRYAEYESRILETARTGFESEIELAIIAEDGQKGTHHIHFVAERDEEGAVVSVLVIGYDITQRRRAEVDLRMAASVFHATAEAIVITDPAGAILKINPAFTQITGYEFDDVCGRNFFELDNKSDGRRECADLLEVLVENHGWSGVCA